MIGKVLGVGTGVVGSVAALTARPMAFAMALIGVLVVVALCWTIMNGERTQNLSASSARCAALDRPLSSRRSTLRLLTIRPGATRLPRAPMSTWPRKALGWPAKHPPRARLRRLTVVAATLS